MNLINTHFEHLKFCQGSGKLIIVQLLKKQWRHNRVVVKIQTTVKLQIQDTYSNNGAVTAWLKVHNNVESHFFH